ncbi:unnamed protein product [Fraxinus pennsylvanica]|uniref:F-box associated domain-containing protein n=1 Tax=Fraxinus pennsylvanica TaxID=56036 RepID=A0AAD2A1N0_9LAMI|nr:unnamed protein product [Fraxinus pennsylvanica]
MDRSITVGFTVEVINRRTDINFVSLHLDLFGVAIRAAEELDHPFGHRYDRTEELDQPFANHIVLWNLATYKYFELSYSEVEYSAGLSVVTDYLNIGLDSWKSVGVSLNLNCYNNSVILHTSHHCNYDIFVSGVVHWMGERSACGLVDYTDYESLIVAFDLAKDEVIFVPCFDLSDPTCEKILGTVHGCLCLFCYHYSKYSNELWVMKDYRIKKSWTKIFTQTSTNYMYIRLIDHSKSKSTMVLEVNKNKLAWYNFEEEEEPITEIDINCIEFSTEACVNHESLVGLK